MRLERLLLPFALAAHLCGCGGGAPDFDEDGVADAADCGPNDRTIYPGAPDPGRDPSESAKRSTCSCRARSDVIC